MCAILSVTAIAKVPSEPSQRTLKEVAKFDLPGPVGKRFDYLTIDTDDGYSALNTLGGGSDVRDRLA